MNKTLMKETKTEELQSRRQFFKKAGGKALPFLAFAAFGSSLLTSCGEDEPNNPNGGSSGCGKSCSGGCDGGCSNNCDSLCGGDCWAYCESKAKR